MLSKITSIKCIDLFIVNLVVPRQLRIARVVDVRSDEIKIVYNGFDDKYAYWVEDDSPDIHPVGWLAKTNHPIELPPVSGTGWKCDVIGCKGYGNSSNRLKYIHVDLKDCPYKIHSWKIAGCAMMRDRLKANYVLITTKLTSSKSKSNIHQVNVKKENLNTEYNNLLRIKEKINERRLNFMLDTNNIEPECNYDNINLFSNNVTSSNNNNLRKAIGLSLVGHNLDLVFMEQQCNYWSKYYAQLGIILLNNTDVRKWSVQEVATYVKKVVATCTSTSSNTKDAISISDRFITQEIDGESFLMLNQDEIMSILKVPFGHALKITNVILLLRQHTFGIDLFNLP